MSTKVFRGSPRWKNGIPANSSIRIEVLPAQSLVYSNDQVSEQVSVELDPGYYAVVIKKFIGKNAAGRLSQLRWEEKFFHDITPEEYNILGAMRPANAKGRLISGGFKFFCGHPSCEYSCNNPMAMVLHELKHKGLTKEDLVKDSEYLIDQQNSEAQIVEEREPKKRGRPRSFNSET